MLSKCFNPACSAHFLYLHQGRLFRFARRTEAVSESNDWKKTPQGIEFFWLCEDCARQFTLEADAARQVRLVTLHRRATGKAATS